ncbi:MAG: VWA domain-containing protein, partial [Verrucomicrobia bacterium]|nr:VWA domain-containing protein [Verrucomicrobiota bacterium]
MFDWEENVFIGLKALYKRLFTHSHERQRSALRATLKEHRGTLLYLGRMLSSADVLLFETDDPTFYAKGRIFLPKEISNGPTKESNLAIYELRTIVAALAISHHWTIESTSTDLPSMLATCAEEFPGLPEKIDSIASLPGLSKEFWPLIGRLPDREPEMEDMDPTSSSVSMPETFDSEAIMEIEGRGQTEVEVIPESALEGPENNLPDHVFEKTETIEEFNGLLRKSDDEETLDQMEEALREVNMKHLIRTPERPRSIYRADVMLDGLCFETNQDTPAKGIQYPEWDYRKASYKPDWCFMSESTQKYTDPAWPSITEGKHRRLILKLKRQFSSITSDWLRMKRQPNGCDFDIDAVVDSRVEWLTGHTPDENIYQDRKRDLHDISAMILLDQSYSTDAWLENVRVLDVIRESIYCVGEVMEDYFESFAIAGFASNTRRNCRFNMLKDFHESWSVGKNRLGSVQSEGYTRIGPALRHAQEKLFNTQSRQKIIILITDGRPCDYDRYEGRHGIHDVKKAIETGLQHGIHTHAFAVEKQAAEYFPQMFT